MPDAEQQNELEMPLYEFIHLPTTVAFNSWFTPTFQAYVNDHPYIRVGSILRNETAILYTSEEHMKEIFKDLGSDFLNIYPEIYGLTDSEALEAAGISQVQQQPYINATGRGTIIGIVDTGIDYTQPVFRYEDGTTKIRYIWDQTIHTEPNDNVSFGTVYTNEQINEALKNDDPYSIVPHKDTVGHGTFLASIAAGRKVDDFIGAAPDAELIVVKLKKANPFYLNVFLVPPEQENAYQSTDIMMGIAFVTDNAGLLKMPSVTCLGLGTNFGGHNGRNRIEQYVTFLSNAPGIAVCTAVGNESNARHHTEGILQRTGDIAPILVRVGDRATSISVYIWYDGWDKISFSIKSPSGEIISRVPFFVGTYFQKKLILEKSTVSVLYHQNESRFAIIQITDIVPGTWEINLHGDIIISGRYHAWLPMTGFISSDVDFVSPTPNYTVVVPSTSRGIISVGAYNYRENSLYINSSWGPTVNSKFAPDFVAPGVDISGFYPIGPGQMTGTSVSAAITAGASALLFQGAIVEGTSPSLNGNRIRTLLIRGSVRDSIRRYPNPQWGYGTLNLEGTVNSLRGE